MAVEVVVDHEAARQFAALRQARGILLQVDALADAVAGKSATDVMRLVPGAVVLVAQQPLHTAGNGRVVIAATVGGRCERRRNTIGSMGIACGRLRSTWVSMR